MMNVYQNVRLDVTLETFLKKAWYEKGELNISQRPMLMQLFDMLVKMGCDYYSLMSVYSEHSLSEAELEFLVNLSPPPKAVMPIHPLKIKECIPRWTPSRYHTAKISQVIDMIYAKLLAGKPGITVYDSNLNVYNKKAVNDRYILIITKDVKAFLNVNRKSTVFFQSEQGDVLSGANCIV